MNRPTFDTQVDDFRSVIFTDRDLADATRLLRRIESAQPMSPAPEGRGAEVPVPSGPDLGKDEFVSRARRALLDRRRRAQAFGRAMFAEPAWDMLLILYIEQDSRRLNISRLTKLADVALTTALRWLDYLEQHQLVRRQPHPTDSRAFFVELADKGSELLDLYFSETPKAGQ